MAATATHRCSHCSREFGRAEHLRRHERTHTNEKPYICELCPEAYSRRDLLRRHEIKAHDISKGVRQRRKSQNSSESSPRSATHLRRGSKTAHAAVESPLPVANETFFPQQQHQMPEQAHQTMWDMPLQPHIEHSESWTDDHWPPNGQQQQQQQQIHPAGEGWPTEGQEHQSFDTHPELDSSQWLNGLYDQSVPGGLANTTDPSLTLDPALMEPSFGLHMAHVPDMNHGVAPAMDFNNTNGQLAQDLPGRVNTLIDQEWWNTILHETAHLQVDIPPPEKLNQYVDGFYAGFHRHQPIFQEHIGSPDSDCVALTLAICAHGALRSAERSNAASLVQGASSLIENQIEGLPALQCRMLIMAYVAWSGEMEDLDNAFRLQGRLASDVRREWAKHLAIHGAMAISWESWCEREALRRATYCSFATMSLISIAYDIPALIQLDDTYDLPAHEAQWRAVNAESWHSATELVGNPVWHTVGDVIQRLGDVTQPVPTGVGGFGCHLVISTLCQRIILFRKACAVNPSLFSQGQHYFSQCLQRWQEMWQQEPESSHTPDHPQGQDHFNSTALLQVAYIRLAADYAPVRKMFTAGLMFDEMFTTSNTLPHIDRNDQSSRAALQACLALHGPGQYAWSWSIQSCLSYFECALFLAQWLGLMQNATDLTFDETHVLDLVSRIVGSSSLYIDQNRPLSIIVLELFIELLTTAHTGGSAVWGLVPKMTRVLQSVSRHLQGA